MLQGSLRCGNFSQTDDSDSVSDSDKDVDEIMNDITIQSYYQNFTSSIKRIQNRVRETI
jgi:hypothetical protein